MRILNLGLENDQDELPEDVRQPSEEPNETEKAIHLTEAEDSTNPEDVVRIANYKEELALIEETQGETDGSDDAETEEDEDDTGSEDEGDEDLDESDDEPEDEDGDDEDDGDEGESDEAPETEATEEGMSDEDEKQLKEATESYTLVSDLVKVVRKAHDRNVLSSKSVEILNITLESIRGRLGLRTDTLVPNVAVESFSTYGGRSEAGARLVAALESSEKGFWAAIAKFFKAIWDAIFGFFTGTRKSLNAARNDLKEATKQKADVAKANAEREKLRAKDAAKAKALEDKYEEFKNQDAWKLVDPLRVDKTTPTEMIDDVVNYVTFLADTVDEANKHGNIIVSKADEILNAASEGEALGKFIDLLGEGVLNFSLWNKEPKATNVTAIEETSSEIMPGGVVFRQTAVKGSPGGSDPMVFFSMGSSVKATFDNQPSVTFIRIPLTRLDTDFTDMERVSVAINKTLDKITNQERFFNTAHSRIKRQLNSQPYGAVSARAVITVNQILLNFTISTLAKASKELNSIRSLLGLYRSASYKFAMDVR